MKKNKREDEWKEDRTPAYTLKGKFPFLETDIDRLYQLIKKQGKVSVFAAAKELGEKKEVVESWGKILEAHELAELYYPIIGPPTLKLKGYDDKKRAAGPPTPPAPAAKKVLFKPKPEKTAAVRAGRTRMRLPPKKLVIAAIFTLALVEVALYFLLVAPTEQPAPAIPAFTLDNLYIMIIAALLVLGTLTFRRKMRVRYYRAEKFRKVQKEIKEIEKLAAGRPEKPIRNPFLMGPPPRPPEAARPPQASEKPPEEMDVEHLPMALSPVKPKPEPKAVKPGKREKFVPKAEKPGPKPRPEPKQEKPGKKERLSTKEDEKERKRRLALEAKKRKRAKEEESVTPESPIYYT